MFDEKAIQKIQTGASIAQANGAVRAAFNEDAPILAIPEGYKLHALEKYQSSRMRACGAMRTENLADFSAYVKKYASEGACVFVNRNTMQAKAVLNLGTEENPGHGDNVAIFAPETSAAWDAFIKIADGTQQPPTKVGGLILRTESPDTRRLNDAS